MTLHLLLTRSGPRVGTDGDGDIDVLVGNSGPNELLVNSGTGHFTTSASFPGGSASTFDMAVGDAGTQIWS